MFAVKSTYSIKTPDGKDIPFYVAGDSIFFAVIDLNPDIDTELFPDYYFVNFENYKGEFISLVNLKEAVSFNSPRCFYQNKDFWMHFVYHNDTKKVIAEVRNAQQFVKEFFRLNLPEDWSRLDVDWVICHLDTHEKWWIETCYKSLQILAANDEQRKDARRVFDEAWEILKERKKAKANDDKRTTVHEVLNKFGLTDDDLIQAVLNAHETKFAKEQSKRQAEFDNQHIYLENELRRILK